MIAITEGDMNKYLLCMCTAILSVILYNAVPSPAQSGVDISYYNPGEGKLTVESFPVTVDYSLTVSGSTTQKTLIMRIDKAGASDSSMKKFKVPVSSDGSFSFKWLFKDGAGTYNIVFFGSPQANALSYTGLAYAKIKVTGTVPASLPGLELNEKVIAFVNTVLGKQVGRGECWDLAQEALDTVMADWARPYAFGVPVNPEKDQVRAGDIIQFTRVKTEKKLENGGIEFHTLGLPDHTAIIYEVTGPGRFRLAHQNVEGVRTVMISGFDLADVRSGKIRIFRPVAAAILSGKD